VQRISGKCNVAQKGAAWPSEKIYAPDGPSSVQKGSILFLEFIFGEAAMAGGVRSAPFGKLMSPKEGCAQRTRGQNPLVMICSLVCRALPVLTQILCRWKKHIMKLASFVVKE